MRRPLLARHRRSLAGLAALAVAVLATPALAHPFGPPPTALVHTEGRTVTVRWRAAVDDMLAIGEHLGVLPEGSVEGSQEGMTQVAPPAASEAALDAAPQLAAYLTDRIRVYQEGRRCAATVRPVFDFVGRGAATVHRCPETVGVVELEITMLHDIHPAYRTFAIDQTPGVEPGQSVHTVAQPRVRWDFREARPGETAPGGREPGGGARMGPFESDFLALIDTPDPSGWFTFTALLLAVGIGAAHALAPGHGKAVAAAYLVGRRGRPRDAVLLGAAVAAMHTATVLALGLALHALAAGSGALDRVGPWLTLAAGLLVLAVGAGSLARVLRRRAADDRGADAAGHAPDGDRAHRHDHGALPAGVSPLSRRGLVLIGLSGGLLPSPSAFLVLTTALFTGRTVFGLALVAAFSVGLATTLALVGLAVLRGRDLVSARAARHPRVVAALDALPLASALLITVAGLWLTTTATMAIR